MVSRRSCTLAVLILLPLLVYLGLGAYALWRTGLFAETFWILPGFWLLTWIVALAWKPGKGTCKQEPPPPSHFTPRDESALQIVRRFQDQVELFSTEQLTDPQFYVRQSQNLARELARHYHPRTDDPISSLTVPEVLAAVRLAVDDLERWILDSVPGSQMMTIRQWKWLQHAPRWWKRAQNAAWAVGVLVNPANVLKYLTSEVTVGPVSQELQTELLAAVYLRFMRQLGFYLIEMNSGRLRGGADFYRLNFGRSIAAPGVPTPAATEKLRPESVTVALVGQVKAGKSSLINVLLGSQAAKSDVLPETAAIERFQLEIPDTDVRITLLDSPGYADAGATRKELAEIQRAVQAADVLLLVMAANSPARSADRKTLEDLHEWFRNHPEFQPPPVIICLTHVDLLSPMREWSPPYDWRSPDSPKERSIHDAVSYVEELFGEWTEAIIPVCADINRGRQANVIEELLPALLGVLSEGQMAAVLRAYHQQLNRERIRTLLNQLRNSGKMLLRVWMEERLLNTFSEENTAAKK